MAEECAAFLSGSYAQYRGWNEGEVPTWARLNPIAHASVDELRALAKGIDQNRDTGSITTWEKMTSVVANELLAVAHDDPACARRLQIDALLPVELELARTVTLATPRRVVELVRRRLEGLDHNGSAR